MHRLLQECYPLVILQSSKLQDLNRQFKTDLITIPVSVPQDSMYTDLVVQLLLTRQHYSSANFSFQKLKKLYRLCSPLSLTLYKWLQTEFVSRLYQEEQEIREALLTSIEEQDHLFESNPDYPVYTKVFELYHRAIINLKQIKMAQFQTEEILKSSPALDII